MHWGLVPVIASEQGFKTPMITSLQREAVGSSPVFLCPLPAPAFTRVGTLRMGTLRSVWLLHCSSQEILPPALLEIERRGSAVFCLPYSAYVVNGVHYSAYRGCAVEEEAMEEASSFRWHGTDSYPLHPWATHMPRSGQSGSSDYSSNELAAVRSTSIGKRARASDWARAGDVCRRKLPRSTRSTVN